MEREHGMGSHLRNGWRMAKVGFWGGVYDIVDEFPGLAAGHAPNWWRTVIAFPLWIVAGAVGGVLYSLLLPDSVRAQPGPATWARTRTGALAGAATGALAGVALASPVFGDFFARVTFDGLVLRTIAIGALIGAGGGYFESLEIRDGAPSEGGDGGRSLDAPARLAEHP
jgi:hypothetical protein